jgi:hypothetical protein
LLPPSAGRACPGVLLAATHMHHCHPAVSGNSQVKALCLAEAALRRTWLQHAPYAAVRFTLAHKRGESVNGFLWTFGWKAVAAKR